MVSFTPQPLYPPFEGFLPWFKSKLNLSRLEYSIHTYFEQALGNVTSKPNFEVLPINCFSLELKIFFSLLGLWLVSECYQIVALKDAAHTEEREQ
jgi:hypothetical protein